MVVLVALVKACETRDLLPVIECVIQRNQHRETMKQLHASASLNTLSFESASTTTFTLGQYTEASTMPVSIEMDCYRTILYLARYQCTTAFHAFFPTTISGVLKELHPYQYLTVRFERQQKLLANEIS